MGISEIAKDVLKIDVKKNRTIFIRVFDVGKLHKMKAEMKSINRSPSTPKITTLQFNRMIKLIDEIIEDSTSLNDYTKAVKVIAAKEMRGNLKFKLNASNMAK